MVKQPAVRKSTLAKREAYRRVVLQSAEALFAANGVEATRIDDIARDAEIATRTLYSVFPAKDDIIHALREERTRQLMDYCQGRARDTGSTFERILETSRATVEFFLEHPNYLRIELFEGLFWADEKSARSPSWRRTFDLYCQLFQQCIEEGSVRNGDPQAFARALLALEQSQLAHWLAGGGKEDEGRTAQATVELLQRSFSDN